MMSGVDVRGGENGDLVGTDLIIYYCIVDVFGHNAKFIRIFSAVEEFHDLCLLCQYV